MGGMAWDHTGSLQSVCVACGGQHVLMMVLLGPRSVCMKASKWAAAASRSCADTLRRARCSFRMFEIVVVHYCRRMYRYVGAGTTM